MSSISLACMRLADQELVDGVILSAYPENDEASGNGNGTDATTAVKRENADDPMTHPSENTGQEAEKPARTRNALKSRLEHIQGIITANAVPVEVAKIKTIDKIVRAAQDPSKNKKALL